MLAVLSLVGPWWTMSVVMTAPGESFTGVGNYGVTGWSVTLTEPGVGTVTNSSGYQSMPHIAAVFQTGFVLAVIGALLGALMVVFVAVAGPRAGLRRVGALMGILAFLVLLLAPLYVMTALPGAMSADGVFLAPGEHVTGMSIGFWGTQTFTFGGLSMAMSYGGGWGWALALVAGIVLLIGGILSLRGPGPAPYPQPVPQPYPPQPYPPQPYPPQGPPPQTPPP